MKKCPLGKFLVQKLKFWAYSRQFCMDMRPCKIKQKQRHIIIGQCKSLTVICFHHLNKYCVVIRLAVPFFPLKIYWKYVLVLPLEVLVFTITYFHLFWWYVFPNISLLKNFFAQLFFRDLNVGFGFWVLETRLSPFCFVIVTAHESSAYR